MPKLWPCPFCGGEARIIAVDYLCGTEHPILACSGCQAEAVSAEAWNRRTPPPATADLIATLRHHGPQSMYKILVSPEERAEILAEWSDPAAPGLDVDRAASPGTHGDATCGDSSAG